MCVRMFVYLSVYLSIYRSMDGTIDLFSYRSIITASVCRYAYLHMHLSVYLDISLSL